MLPIPTLSLSGSLNQIGVGLLADSLFSEDRARPDRLKLDLRRVSFAEPYGIAVLVTLLEWLASRGATIEVVFPPAMPCGNYLAACGFLRHLETIADVRCEASLRRIRGGTPLAGRLALCKLRGPSDIPSLSAEVERLIGAGDATFARFKGPILATITELCANIFHHADYPMGWIVGQRFQNGYQNRPYFEIAIADAGQGIRRSLGRRIESIRLGSDADAIERMLKEGLTASNAPYRGNGYYVLQHAARELDGSFSLRSGRGAMIRDRGGSLHKRPTLTAWPGTQLHVRFTGG